MEIEQRFYSLVAANAQAFQDYVIPNGKVLVFKEMLINTPTPYAETGVVVFDPSGANVIIMSCSGNSQGSTSTELLGDGVKVVRMTLINTAPLDQYMGAQFRGSLV